MGIWWQGDNMWPKHALLFYLVYLNAKQKGWSIMKCVPAPQTHTSCASNLHFKAMCPLCPACKLPHFYKYTHTHTAWRLQHQTQYHTYTHKRPCMCVFSFRHRKISHTHTAQVIWTSLGWSSMFPFPPSLVMKHSVFHLSLWLKQCLFCLLLSDCSYTWTRMLGQRIASVQPPCTRVEPTSLLANGRMYDLQSACIKRTFLM